MEMALLWFMVPVLLCGVVEARKGVKHYYMADMCGATIDLESRGAESMKLSLTSRSAYQNNMNCTLTVHGYPGRRFMFVFEMFDIMYTPDCRRGDYLQLLDGDASSSRTVYQFPGPICGRSALPHAHTNGETDLTFRFISTGGNMRKNRGFKILLTISHISPCDDDEYECSNQECISDNLVCDGLNHCGDVSGSCAFSWQDLVILFVSAAVLISIVALIVAICACCKIRGRSKPHYTVPRRMLSSPPHDNFYQPSGPIQYGTIPNLRTQLKYHD